MLLRAPFGELLGQFYSAYHPRTYFGGELKFSDYLGPRSDAERISTLLPGFGRRGTFRWVNTVALGRK